MKINEYNGMMKWLTRPKAKPMPIVNYIDTMNKLYGNSHEEAEDPGYLSPEEKKDILKSIPVSPLVKKPHKKEKKMADLDNLPSWFLKNLDDLMLEYQEDIGERPRTLNDLEKWYRNKHGTTKIKSKEKVIKVAEKPKPKPPVIEFLELQDYLNQLDPLWFEEVIDKEEEETRRRNFEKILKEHAKSKIAGGLEAILSPGRKKT